MTDIQEIEQWEKALNEELKGLKFCKHKVNDDAEIPSQIKYKLADIITSLKAGIMRVLVKISKIKGKDLEISENENKVARIRHEYIQIMNNVDRLLSTVGVKNFEPRYLHSTYNSRHRSSSPQWVKHEDETLTKLKTEKRIEKSSSEQKIKTRGFWSKEFEQIKKTLKSVKKYSKVHRHIEYEEKLASLQGENNQLKIDLENLKSEQQTTFESIRKLTERIEYLEKGPQIASSADNQGTKKERYLLKSPKQEEEKV
ncbi:unnamed protein product [Blepharisma stoltei]|uniref:Viral A-type inclusion protein n=1 Tax=Blepharisma stoltei TaxID=1481888 RepID=A0AAU9IGF5_9CILI|nr:unnamed protein product [Blepharisma stoltei]